MIYLLRPIKSNRITQGFGENRACITNSGRIVGKTGGSCPTGSRDFYRKMGMIGHNGTDRAAWHTEPVFFSAGYKGWAKTEKDKDGGVGVDVVSAEPILRCIEKDCGEIHHIKQRTWHHKKIAENISDGTELSMGDLIAWADSTGASSGNHVHEGMKWCDKDGNGLHKDNGYYGAFNPNAHPDIKAIDEFVIDYMKKEGLAPQIQEPPLSKEQIIRKLMFLMSEFFKKLI